MKIHTLVVGPIETNCYIVEDEQTKEAIIIDPGEDANKIFNFLETHPLKIRYIVITHGHFDHVGANWEIKEKTKALILIHELDVPMLSITSSPKADRYLVDKDQIDVGNLSFTVLHTPGHTPGGICLYNERERVLFSGDTLFAGTYGRTDLPYSSEKDMKKSLEKLLKLPPETKVYPGHGKPTTIGSEQNVIYDAW